MLLVREFVLLEFVLSLRVGIKEFHVNIKHDVLYTVVIQREIWAVFCSRTAMYLSPVMVMEIVSFHSCSVKMWKEALNVA